MPILLVQLHITMVKIKTSFFSALKLNSPFAPVKKKYLLGVQLAKAASHTFTGHYTDTPEILLCLVAVADRLVR